MNVLRAAIICIRASLFSAFQYFEKFLPRFVCKIGSSCYIRQVLSSIAEMEDRFATIDMGAYTDAGLLEYVQQAHDGKLYVVNYGIKDTTLTQQA